VKSWLKPLLRKEAAFGNGLVSLIVAYIRTEENLENLSSAGSFFRDSKLTGAENEAKFGVIHSNVIKARQLIL
jgi:hypothetical protein